MTYAVSRPISGARGFVTRQKHNYRVAITRAAASNFLANLTAQYNSIYTVALGADPAQLGTISSIGSGISALISTPVGQMGRWSGLLGLFRGLVSIPAPIVGGLIWRQLGPAYVFLIPLASDLLLRIPLLATVPETLEAGRAVDQR